MFDCVEPFGILLSWRYRTTDVAGSSLRMAAITLGADIRIVANIPVFIIYICTVTMFMAGDTRENLVIIGIVMAFATICPGPAM